MQKIMIAKTEQLNKQLILYPKEPIATDIAHSLTDGKRMLVDSDNLAFIYLLELEDSFVHIHIPSDVWPELRTAYEAGCSMFLFLDNKTKAACSAFQPELESLLENIRGNSNYGTELPRVVDIIFPQK